jgi:hypothetical protein
MFSVNNVVIKWYCLFVRSTKACTLRAINELFCTCSDELVSVRWLRSSSSEEQLKQIILSKLTSFVLVQMNYFQSKTNYNVSLQKLVSVTRLRWDLLVQMSRSFEINTKAFILQVGTHRWVCHIWETYVQKHSLCQKKRNYFVLVLGQVWSNGSARCDKQPLHQRTSTDTPLFSYTSRGDADGICPKHTQVCSPFCPLENSVCVWNEDHGPNESNFIEPALERANERCTRGG